MDIDKKLTISEYNRVYGGLLTPYQHEMLSLYYDCDVSLNEIAEQYNISRQAIRDALQRGERALLDFESKLSLVKFKKSAVNTVKDALTQMEKGNYTEAASALKTMLSEE